MWSRCYWLWGNCTSSSNTLNGCGWLPVQYRFHILKYALSRFRTWATKCKVSTQLSLNNGRITDLCKKFRSRAYSNIMIEGQNTVHLSTTSRNAKIQNWELKTDAQLDTGFALPSGWYRIRVRKVEMLEGLQSRTSELQGLSQTSPLSPRILAYCTWHNHINNRVGWCGTHCMTTKYSYKCLQSISHNLLSMSYITC